MLTLALSLAQAADTDPPPSGLGGIITGSILLGVGGLNLVSAPTCLLDAYGDLVGETGQDVCLISSLALGGGLAIAGVPVLLGGVQKRKAYKAWKEEQVSVEVAPNGVVVRGTF